MEVDYEVLMDQIAKSPAIGENTFIVSSYVFPFLNHLIKILGQLYFSCSSGKNLV